MQIKINTILFLSFFSLGQLHSQLEIEEVSMLSNSIKETSGLLYFNGSLITHNDSGNDATLFELDDETGEILRSVELINAVNVDWEDIAQDENFIYIGDFGNNSGNRRDLAIYKIGKQEYLSQNQVTASVMSFSYEDQLEFEPVSNSDWDAEALFVLDDSLYILTKQWQSLGTTLYRLPKNGENVTAEKVEEYNVNGLVTGAVYNKELNQLVVIGYSPFLLPFIEIIDQLSAAPPFFINTNRTELEIVPLQVESIATDGQRYFFTSEEFINATFGINSLARLFFFEVISPSMPNTNDGENEVILYGEKGAFEMGYSVLTNEPVLGMSILDVSGKELLASNGVMAIDGVIDVSVFASGIYYVRFFFSDRNITKPFIKF